MKVLTEQVAECPLGSLETGTEKVCLKCSRTVAFASKSEKYLLY